MNEEIQDIYRGMLKEDMCIDDIKYNWALNNKFIPHALGKSLFCQWELMYPENPDPEAEYMVTEVK